ncbi:MAG: CUAEP/CCAEP-tail radical SAM protein, partial [Acidimicrobiia bacterium]|nr:CUAEP/CCAEP-tail radical SAM protein [Acidimicrobiia bacterium]
MRVLLVSTYELGHQPLAVTSPARRLTDAGHEVRAMDLSVEPLSADHIAWADRIAVSVPMHTALR